MAVSSKLAVITGGTSGIGREIAVQFADEGWDIAVCDVNGEDAAETLSSEITSRGRRFFYRRCNVGIKSEVAAFYDALETAMGTAPSLVVNNAGIQTWAHLLDLEESDWDNVIQTNLKGCFLNIQIAAKAMIRHGIKGSFVNIGSGCNELAFPQLVDYSSSKGGIQMLTKVSAAELGAHGLRVNCVAPGGILIERTQREAPNYAEVWAEITPLNRVGFPADIANAVSFLASDKADFITGQTLYVDGGAYSKANWPY
ncbi:MAG: SDR family NAD(P)-dependent oxidoreductase [bacterium]